MEQVLKAINDWPTILQGVVGSAIFWIILLAGQKATSYGSNWLSRYSMQSRRSYLISKMYKCAAFSGRGDGKSAFHVATLIYRSSRHLFKALMWLALGLIFQSVISILGVIGFVGCLYQLFKAYDIVKPYPDGTDLKAELEQVTAELGFSEEP